MFHLYADWSSTGIAATLHQCDADGKECLVACASRSLNIAEQNYPAWKGEMLIAAVWSVKTYQPYSHSREFFLHTDHEALLWLLRHKVPVGQQMRWILALQEYKFTLVHKPDDTVYTHEGLTEELGIAVSQRPAATVAQQCSGLPVHALAEEQGQPVFASQLQYEALAGCFDMLPADIRNISVQHLKAAVDQVDTAVPWLVVAGWPCQDFSLAGPSRGLAADRSRLLFQLVRLVGALQQLWVAQPTAYQFENVPIQQH
eukprot:gene9602-biopygen11500